MYYQQAWFVSSYGGGPPIKGPSFIDAYRQSLALVTDEPPWLFRAELRPTADLGAVEITFGVEGHYTWVWDGENAIPVVDIVNSVVDIVNEEN